MTAQIWILLFAVFTTVNVFAQDHNDTKQLLIDVLADYNFRIRPVANQTDSVRCTIGLSLLKLNDVSDTAETITTTAYLDVKWYDVDLVWDPALYGNVSSIFLPQKEIWRPDVRLKNDAGDIKPVGDDSLTIEVDSDGYVMWYPFEKFISECSINVRYYPFDEQVCQLAFVAWSYKTYQVYFDTNGIYMGFYKESSQWELLNISMRRDDNQQEPTVVISLQLKRKPMYIVLTVISPIILLAALDLLVFVLPVSSGEKVGYAITVFLAFAVFLTVIEASMPKNAESVALMSLYMIIITANSTLITLFSILLTKVSSMGHLVAPKPFVVLSRIGRFDFSCCQKRKHKLSKVAIQALTLTDVDDKCYAKDEKCYAKDEKCYAKDEKCCAKNEKCYAKDEKCSTSRTSSESAHGVDDENKPTWESIIHGLEMFCLMFWSLVFVVVSLVIIIGTKTNTI